MLECHRFVETSAGAVGQSIAEGLLLQREKTGFSEPSQFVHCFEKRLLPKCRMKR
jgi:hypothetical protein